MSLSCFRKIWTDISGSRDESQIALMLDWESIRCTLKLLSIMRLIRIISQRFRSLVGFYFPVIIGASRHPHNHVYIMKILTMLNLLCLNVLFEVSVSLGIKSSVNRICYKFEFREAASKITAVAHLISKHLIGMKSSQVFLCGVWI
jgi:hypothetical protein